MNEMSYLTCGSTSTDPYQSSKPTVCRPYISILAGLYFFFFSSRRRHTRYWRDWSSDVCSSDLRPGPGLADGQQRPLGRVGGDDALAKASAGELEGGTGGQHVGVQAVVVEALGEIGRAACRERVEISVVGGSLKKKNNSE